MQLISHFSSLILYHVINIKTLTWPSVELKLCKWKYPNDTRRIKKILWCEPKAGSPKRGTSSAQPDGPAIWAHIAATCQHRTTASAFPLLPFPSGFLNPACSGGPLLRWLHFRSLLRRWGPTDRCLPRRFLSSRLPRHQAPLRCIRRRYPVSPVVFVTLYIAINESPKPCNAKSIHVAKMSRV